MSTNIGSGYKLLDPFMETFVKSELFMYNEDFSKKLFEGENFRSYKFFEIWIFSNKLLVVVVAHFFSFFYTDPFCTYRQPLVAMPDSYKTNCIYLHF